MVSSVSSVSTVVRRPFAACLLRWRASYKPEQSVASPDMAGIQRAGNLQRCQVQVNYLRQASIAKEATMFRVKDKDPHFQPEMRLSKPVEAGSEDGWDFGLGIRGGRSGYAGAGCLAATRTAHPRGPGGHPA
jgi:hypothetical protein